MTDFKDVTPGIWEAKRKGHEGDYNVLIKVYGYPNFYDIEVWDYNMPAKNNRTELTKFEMIVKFEFGNKIKELEG